MISIDQKTATLRQSLKEKLKRHEKLWGIYWEVKQQFLRLANLRYYFYDIKNTYKSMYWAEQSNNNYWSLSSELLFQYHKIEKGLIIEGPKRIFGIDAVNKVIDLLARWRELDFDERDPVFVGAVETLNAYSRNISINRLTLTPGMEIVLEKAMSEYEVRNADFETPISLGAAAKDTIKSEAFDQLVRSRHSVRSYSEIIVEKNILNRAVSAAQTSPSVCNRQSCETIVLDERLKIANMLALQNGNRGFGQKVPTLAIITADETSFVNASERHQQYVDGGLYSMNFLLSLESQGVATCCLNWCVTPSIDKAAHELLKLAGSKRIIMLVAFGYAARTYEVPRSARRSLMKNI